MGQLRESRRSNDFKFYIDLSTPTETQMKNVVHGDDRYQPVPKLGMLIAALLMFAFFIGGVMWALVQ